MVPAVYKKMKSFPLTPNGKLDRNKLPAVELKKNGIETCSTKTEKLLAKIIVEILEDKQIDYKDIDINAPFIVLGLDSLGIIQVQTKLLKYHYVLNTQEFYKYNTIKLLATNIDSNKYTYKEQDIEVPGNFRHTYDELLSKIDQKVSDSRYLGNVFLTGANGFIGIHILRDLIKTTDINVYCLVRGDKKTTSVNRLIEKYKIYFEEDISDLIGDRLFVYDGDITSKDLGLKDKNKKEIQKNVTTVIHTAAKVKHYGEYEKFNAINIEGTRNVLELAYQNKFRFIHLSSISVSGNYLVKQDNRNIEFNENSLYVGQKYTDNVYVNSKLEAEKIVLEYMEKGLTAQIHRIGILAGRYRDGVFQSNIDENAFYGRIKSMICLGAISDKMLDQRIEFTPVDLCTRDIVALAKNRIADNRIFHLFNHNLVKIGDIIQILEDYGIHVEIVSNNAFKKILTDLSKNADSMKLSGIINDITSNDDEELALNYNYTIRVKSDFTQKYLHLLKCDWNRNDKKYLRKLIRYAKKVGFI